jgi:hypothetical protein
MVEINRFILNGHVFVHSLSSKDIEVEVLNSFRVFLFQYADLLNFSYRHWADVIFVLTGEGPVPIAAAAASTSTVRVRGKETTSEKKKKLNKYEREVQSYRQERILSNASSPSLSLSPLLSSQPIPPSSSSSSVNTKGHIVLTIPFNFTPKSLSVYLTRHLSSHTNFIIGRVHERVAMLEEEE